MKIALDVRKVGEKETGSEIYITNLVRNLAKLDNENHYFLLTSTNAGLSRAKRILGKLAKNFSFHVVKPSNKIFWTQYSLPKFLKQNRIDVLHVEYTVPVFSNNLATKIITTIHDVSFKVHPDYILPKDRMILNFFIPRTVKRADKIIAVSRFTQNEISQAYQISKRKIQVVYNGVQKERFKPKNQLNPSDLAKVKKKYGLDKRYILNISSLQPRKNLPDLIKAYRDYITRFRDEETYLVIGGEKSYNYDYRIDKYFRDLVLKRRIKKIGYVTDKELPYLYAGAALYVSPSIYEGFDLPIVEVMQSGVPVLASNLSCHKEIIKDAGILVEPKKVLEFSKSINQALNNNRLRNNLVKKSLLRAKDFDWGKSAIQTLAVYDEVLRN
jgi:glycosyltransferase involved in cell wall biosynthesis